MKTQPGDVAHIEILPAGMEAKAGGSVRWDSKLTLALEHQTSNVLDIFFHHTQGRTKQQFSLTHPEDTLNQRQNSQKQTNQNQTRKSVRSSTLLR